MRMCIFIVFKVSSHPSFGRHGVFMMGDSMQAENRTEGRVYFGTGELEGRSFNLTNNPKRFSAHLMLFCFVKNRGSQ